MYTKILEETADTNTYKSMKVLLPPICYGFHMELAHKQVKCDT